LAVKKATKTVSINGSGGDREKTLELALAQIEKAFGRGAVMRMGESGGSDGIKTVSTGSIALDLALGVGGLLVVESLRSSVLNRLVRQLLRWQQ
jgi:hypothetical protein